MDVEVHDRTDPDLISANENDLALPGEVAALHNWPDRIPDVEPVTVAVMDSGIHPSVVENHPWLEGASVVGRYDAVGRGGPRDEVGHGTGVASIIARLAPGVEFIDVRIFGTEGRTSFSEVRRAYEWMIERAGEIDLVNMSWGARRNIMQINLLHERLVSAGINDVVAAGNTGTDGGSPATSGLAFSAGALTEDGTPARFSSFDPDQGNPDVAAVGVNVKMARTPRTDFGHQIDQQFVKGSGTSFSAPVTTAAYATALALRRSDNWDERFVREAEDIEGTPVDGAGVLKLPSGLSQPPEEESPDEEPPEGEPPEEEPPEEEPPGEEPPSEDEPSEDEPSLQPIQPPPTMDEADLYVYEATLDDVIDGDTVDLNVDLGFGTSQRVRVRLAGVDTAEIFFVGEDSEEFEEGQRHKEFTEEYLRQGESASLLVRTSDRAGEHGVWYGDIRRVGAEKSLVEALVDEFPSVAIGDGGAGDEPPETEPVSLEAISGVGPKRAEDLRGAGYESAEDVAGATAEELSEDIGVSKKQAGTLVDNADDA